MIFETVKIGKQTCSSDEVTYLNYLALAAAILAPSSNERYTKGLYDNEEADKRIKEIEDLRARGEKTELELWYKSEVNKVARNSSVNKEGNNISIFDLRTNTEKHYSSLRYVCEQNDLKYENVKVKLRENKGNSITINRYIIKRIDRDEVDISKLHAKECKNNLWTPKELSYLVKNRPNMTYREIANVLNKTKQSCESKYLRIKKEGKLDFYKNLKIS